MRNEGQARLEDAGLILHRGVVDFSTGTTNCTLMTDTPAKRGTPGWKGWPDRWASKGITG